MDGADEPAVKRKSGTQAGRNASTDQVFKVPGGGSCCS